MQNLDIHSDKQKTLQLAMDQIERQFGKGAIMKLGGRMIADVPVISTGSLALDHALGVGGIPRGRVVEIFGPESGGKTTLALHINDDIDEIMAGSEAPVPKEIDTNRTS